MFKEKFSLQLSTVQALLQKGNDVSEDVDLYSSSLDNNFLVD